MHAKVQFKQELSTTKFLTLKLLFTQSVGRHRVGLDHITAYPFDKTFTKNTSAIWKRFMRNIPKGFMHSWFAKR